MHEVVDELLCKKMALSAECAAALLSFREPSFSNISVILLPQHRDEIKVIVLSLYVYKAK